MRYYEHSESPDVAVLIKPSGLKKGEIEKYYLQPTGCKAISIDLDYGGKKKPSAKVIKAYLEDELLPTVRDLGINTVLCADGEYFKKLTKEKKAEPHYGYVLPCKIDGYEDISVVLTANYQAVTFNPASQDKIDLSLEALRTHLSGNYVAIGSDIIHSQEYPDDYLSIQHMLHGLHQYDAITSDIEAFSLKHYSAGIGTIGFAWDKHNGFSFAVDYVECEPYDVEVWCKKDKKFKTRKAIGKQVVNEPVRKLLKEFFTNYKGRIIWHNASFDCYILIYQLWMDDLLDQEGLLEGLDIMHGSMECTKLITYLATNSCAGNHLGLKAQAHEFAGNYAEDEINDIRMIPKDDLLKYNLVDCLATWYVHEKNYPIMEIEKQLSVYEDYFKPFVIDILQMQLTGMCLDMQAVNHADETLSELKRGYMETLNGSALIQQFVQDLRQKKVDEDNAKLKNATRTIEDSCIQRINFNPNSNPQLSSLLYDYMELPVIDLTDSKQPATGKKTLKKLKNHVANTPMLTPEEIDEREKIIDALRGFADVDKILTAFIPSFKEAPKAPDGMHYLFGNFVLGGTVSGRLSSKSPNMQNLPSGSAYGKLIKKCFVGSPGFIFCGADFNALEDRINTLLTNDPNKEKVLLDGFDGHSFRTYHFWPDKFPHINPDCPESINIIQKDFDADRSKSKPVHFAMQYQGTWATLVSNCGFSEEEAKAIEANYQNLYKVSFDWLKDGLIDASKKGYAIGCFGLKIRAPIIGKSIMYDKVTTNMAKAEGRTLGNAISGQSYGLLNCRATWEFMGRVRKSKYRTKIKLCSQIHDAIYLMVADDFEVIEWVNTNLAECMSWQELPELKHDRIGLPAELDLFYPNWANAVTLPNNISEDEIYDICVKAADKYKGNS